MALAAYQVTVLRLLAERRRRQGVSYVAGGAAKLYVNGVLDTTRTGLASMPTNADTAYIGNRADNARDYQGDLDELVLSKVVRDACWVKLNYQNQKADQTLVEFR